MKTIIKALLIALVTLGGIEANASDNTVFETTFAGFPENTSQHDLRELSPNLFAAEKMDRETGCLSAALYFEARGESRLGQIAVAQVIINRVASRAYPNSICEVVWQNAHKRNRCQFSFTCDGKMDRVRNRKVWVRTKRLAEAFLNIKNAGSVPHSFCPSESLDEKTRRSTHYHATYVKPGWSRKLERMRKIGRHIFYVSARVERTMPTET